MSALSPGGELAATIEAFRIANAPTPAPRPQGRSSAASPGALSPDPAGPRAPVALTLGQPPIQPIDLPAPSPEPDVVVAIGSPPARPAPQAAYLKAVAELLAAPQVRSAPAIPGQAPAVAPPTGVPAAPPALPAVPSIVPLEPPLQSVVAGSVIPTAVPAPAVLAPTSPPFAAAVVPSAMAIPDVELPSPLIPPAVLAIARAALDEAYLGAAKGDPLAAALLAKAPPETLFAALDRRILFAVAEGDAFPPVERRIARAWLARVAGDILAALPGATSARAETDILSAFVAHLEAAGPEEQASADWLVQRAAAGMARDRLLVAADGDVEILADRRPTLAAVRTALEGYVAGTPAAVLPTMRDVPLLGTPYLSPEMLLFGLAAVGRFSERRPDAPDEKRRRPRPGADSRRLRLLPLEADWAHVEDATPGLSAFEAASGYALPGDYRSFLENVNGGRPYPNMFAYCVGALQGSTTPAMTFLDRLHDWRTVEATWRGERFGHAAPPEMIAIGADPGGLEIMLSLRAESFGAVFCWPHASAPWGAPANCKAFRLAASFDDFLDTLTDVEEGAGFRYWNRPALRRLVRFIDR